MPGGRPKGSRGKRQLGIESVAKRLTMSPLDVMLTAMENQVKKKNWDLAHVYAKDAAPYLHAKIQSVTISGDPNNPLTTLNLHVNKEQFAELAQQLLIEG